MSIQMRRRGRGGEKGLWDVVAVQALAAVRSRRFAVLECNGRDDVGDGDRVRQKVPAVAGKTTVKGRLSCDRIMRPRRASAGRERWAGV